MKFFASLIMILFVGASASAAIPCAYQYTCTSTPNSAVPSVVMVLNQANPQTKTCEGTYAITPFGATSPQMGLATMDQSNPAQTVMMAHSRIIGTWEYDLTVQGVGGETQSFTGMLRRRSIGGVCGSAPCGYGAWSSAIPMTCHMSYAW